MDKYHDKILLSFLGHIDPLLLQMFPWNFRAELKSISREAGKAEDDLFRYAAAAF